MSKKVLPYATSLDIRKLKNPEKYHIRIGAFYSKFNTHQRSRFNRLVNSFANKLAIDQRSEAIKLTLIRYIAVLIIRIDDALSDVVGEVETDYGSDREKWLLLNHKELRDSISTLHTIAHVSKKKEGLGSFDELRDVLRGEESLPPSKEKGFIPDGKDRRFHNDGVTRSETT